jgi:hypothetical protein
MNRLQKYIERNTSGERSGRIAYGFRPSTLPDADPGMEWCVDVAFDAANALLENEGLKGVFKTAIADGYAIIRDADH